MSKIIIVANQKGGVGKSTITALIASYMNTLGKKVLVIDADMQKSLASMRESEEEEYEKYEHSKNTYDLVRGAIRELPEVIENIKKMYNYIFIDIPGNMGQEGVIKTLFECDVFIVPTGLSTLELKSTKEFIEFIKKNVVKYRKEIGKETKIYGMFNRIKTNTQEAKFINEERLMGIEFIKPPIKDSIKMQRNVSTIDFSSGEYVSLLSRILEKIEQ